jgi:hypothetical protein
MILLAFVSGNMPVRRAEAYDSKMAAHFGFDGCRCLRGPGGADCGLEFQWLYSK